MSETLLYPPAELQPQTNRNALKRWYREHGGIIPVNWRDKPGVKPRPVLPEAQDIRSICENFLVDLGTSDTNEPLALDPNLFSILDDEARKRGYKLVADQLGIRGTYIHFERT